MIYKGATPPTTKSSKMWLALSTVFLFMINEIDCKGKIVHLNERNLFWFIYIFLYVVMYIKE